MHASWLQLTFMAVGVLAGPLWPHPEIGTVGESKIPKSLSDYFNALAFDARVAKSNAQPAQCNIAAAQMPSTLEPFATPGLNLEPYHIALGRGTQNYTCANTSIDTVPEAAGAVATLFDISCLAATHPELVSTAASMAIHFRPESATAHRPLGPASWSISGVHYFSAPGVPYFNLNSGNRPAKLGEAFCEKNASAPAPEASAVGLAGDKAVPWLKLNTVAGSTNDIKEVFRVNTVGGSAPATCQGQSKTFEVEYAAVYWFWRLTADGR